jgi:tetratricopeptide (TPR) repeat protein
VADEKIPETGAQIKCPKCNTMIVVQRTPLVELIPEPLVQPAHTPSTPLSSTPMSPQSKKALGYIIVALLWIGLSASLPILGVLANILIGAIVIMILALGKLRHTLWGVLKKEPPAKPPLKFGISILAVAILGVGAGVFQLQERSQKSERIEKNKLVQAWKEKKQEEESKRQEDAKLERFKKLIGEAKKLAKDPAKVEEAVSAFTKADRFGDLSDEDTVLFSSLLKSAGGKHIKKNKLYEAVILLEKAKELNPHLKGIDKLMAKAERMKRAEDVKEWIDQALTVSGDKNLCDTSKEIAEAWEQLQNVTRKDKLYGKAKVAAKKLERCRKKVIRGVVKLGMDLMRIQRAEMANKLEVLCLDQGMDVRMVLLGKNKDRMKIIYILFNRAWAHKMTEGGSMAEGSFLANLQKVGFKRVTFSDGYDSSFYYDLKPENEVKAFSKTLDGMGLGDPLKL